MLFSFSFTLFTVYNLNNSYFVYEICSKFQQNHFSRYSKGIGVIKFVIITISLYFFNFFTLFTVYNLNDSYVIYKNCSTFQKKLVGQYS